MHVVAEEMPSPIADEFGRVYEEQNLGIAHRGRLKNMCERVPNLDLRFFVTAVASSGRPAATWRKSSTRSATSSANASASSARSRP